MAQPRRYELSDEQWEQIGGLLIAIFQVLQVEPDFENISIDSTSIKAHQHSAGAKKKTN